jgi:hypothetical protein
MRCIYAGSYITGIEGITFRDCFGLIRLTLRNPNPLRMQVLPVVTGMAGEDMSRVIWEMVHGAPGRKREYENTLGVDLAKYSAGDPLKRIHWKNYARSGELFVRLPEEREYDLLCRGIELGRDELLRELEQEEVEEISAREFEELTGMAKEPFGFVGTMDDMTLVLDEEAIS